MTRTGIVLAALLFAPRVFGDTLMLVPPAPHGPGPGHAVIIFEVEVSDGLATVLAIDNQSGSMLFADDGAATIGVAPFGIINPAVSLHSFNIEFGTLDTISDTFGTAEIPISLSVTEAHLIGPVPARGLGSALLGEFGSLTLGLAELDLLVAGDVELLGSTLPFSISASDLSEGFSNLGFRPDAADDVTLINAEVHSPFIDIGEASGGVTVRLRLYSMGADNIQFVPEPLAVLSAISAALGLAAVAAANRRAARMSV